MMKFFRKHNKQLLAVFMALLLVVWLGGSALEALLAPKRDAIVIATSKLGDIGEGDRIRASSEARILESLGIPWPRLGAAYARVDPLGIIEWVILTREAQQCGMNARRIEAEDFLANRGMTPDQVRLYSAKRDIKPESVYAAVASFINVQRMVNLTVSSATRSEADLRAQAQKELETIKVDLVSFNARTFEIPDEAFSEDEIQAHFMAYRDKEQGKGLEFGYHQPPRVKAEYFKIDLQKVADHVRVRESTLESRAEQRWRENPKHVAFARPREELTQDKAEDGEDGSEDEGPPKEPPSPWYETFEEARDAGIRYERVEAARTHDMGRITGWLMQQLSDPWFDREKGEDGYPVPPEGVLAEDYYESVLARIPEQFRYGDAVSIARTGYFKQRDAWRQPDIGPAQLHTGGPTTDFFRDLVFRVQGVVPMPTAQGADSSLHLAVGQSCAVPVIDRDGNIYIYRVIDVKPAGPPDSVDDVRDDVIRDLRLLRGFERAREEADNFRASIPGAGLKTAFDSSETLPVLLQYPSGYYSPEPFARRRKGSSNWAPHRNRAPRVADMQLDAAFVDEVFALADRPEGDRVTLIADDKLATVLIVECLDLTPMRIDQFTAERGKLLAQINRTAITQAVSQWLDPVRIRDRNEFAPTQQR